MDFNSAPKLSDENLVSRSYKTGTAKAQLVLDKLKTLGSSNSISNISSTFISSPTNKLSVLLTIIRYIIALLILGFIIINIFASMKILSPNLEKLFNPILVFFDNGVKKDTNNTKENPTDLNTAIDKTAANKTAANKTTADKTAANKTAADKIAADKTAANKTAVADKTANNIKGIPIDTNKLTDQLPSEQPVDKLFKKEETKQSTPQPNETDLFNCSSKSSYCYIGNDKGIRNCAKINEYDKCMSGDIFPTHNICINPNLRT